MSPDGIVSWGDDLSRASGGSMEKVAERKYSLKLFSAQPSDSGVYRCVVSVYAGRKSPGPSTAATLTQRSEGVTVNLKTKGEPQVALIAIFYIPCQLECFMDQIVSVSPPALIRLNPDGLSDTVSV